MANNFDVTFMPSENVNKKSYTPTTIVKKYVVFDTISGKEEKREDILKGYSMSVLLEYLAEFGTAENITELMNDYPGVTSAVRSDDGDYLIHMALWKKNVPVIDLLLKRDMHLKDFDGCNGYELALYKPDIWSVAYKNLSSLDLYNILEKSTSDIYAEGAYEVLFNGRNIEILKNFKMQYPETYQLILKNKENSEIIKSIYKKGGELLYIVAGYDDLYKELLNDVPVNGDKSKPKKF